MAVPNPFTIEWLETRCVPLLRKTLKPGARVVSHDFKIGDWAADRTERVRDDRGNDHVLFLWMIKK